MIEKNNEEIWDTSQLNVGTTFTLPLTKGDE